MNKLEEKHPEMEKWEKNNDLGSVYVFNFYPPQGGVYSVKYTPLLCGSGGFKPPPFKISSSASHRALKIFIKYITISNLKKA